MEFLLGLQVRLELTWPLLEIVLRLRLLLERSVLETEFLLKEVIEEFRCPGELSRLCPWGDIWEVWTEDGEKVVGR